MPRTTGSDTYGIWLAYASCGGRFSHDQLDAYLAGAVEWPRLEAEILAVARAEQSLVGAPRAAG